MSVRLMSVRLMYSVLDLVPRLTQASFMEGVENFSNIIPEGIVLYGTVV